MEQKYFGVIPPIITPVDSQERVDEDGLRALIEHSICQGLHGIFVAGSNGEAMALTQAQRNRAIQVAVDQVAGRVPLFCGIMDSSTCRVIENLKVLEDLGGTCAVITPVFYDRHTSQAETIRHFEAISRASSIDLILYNIPPFTNIKLTPDTVLQIAQLDHVAGYKDSTGSLQDFLQVLYAMEGKPFSCMIGVTPLAVPGLLLGADGFVPVLSPLFPELFIQTYQAAKAGDLARAKALDRLVQDSSRILAMTKNATAAAKFAISQLGYTNKRVLMPQDTIAPEEEQAILRKIDQVNQAFAALQEK